MKKKTSLKKPNPFVWGIFYTASKLVSKLKFNLKIERNELKGTKGPCLIIVNHAAAIDFMPVCTAIKRRTHFVISKSFYQALSIKPMLDTVRVIPKNQFQTSIADMRKMKSALDDNKLPLVIYPAGLMTANGINTPMPDSTGKVLKWFNQDVYVARLRGSYLTNPKWGKGWRKGKIRLEIYKLFDKETLKTMDGDKVLKIAEEHLSYDEYAIQKQEMVAYKGGDKIAGLENVLFVCPHCGAEFSFTASTENTLTCEKCGYSVKANKYGLLEQNGDIPLYYDTASDWYRFIEKTLAKELEDNPDFLLTDDAEIYKINDKKHKYEPAGKCKITLNSKEFTLDGELNGTPFKNSFPTTMYPTLPIKPGQYFEIQDGQEIYRIMLSNGKKAIKWIASLEYFHKNPK
jgi:1-acyl-sn-glycerol-3-phosphate acyltransferase